MCICTFLSLTSKPAILNCSFVTAPLLPPPHSSPPLPSTPLPSPPFLPYPQGVSVEAVDPVFQAKMLDMLKQTGRLVHLMKLFVKCVRACVGAWVRGCMCRRSNRCTTRQSRVKPCIVESLYMPTSFKPIKHTSIYTWTSCSSNVLTSHTSPSLPFTHTQPRDGGGVVPQPPWVWLLAVGSGHEHTAGQLATT